MENSGFGGLFGFVWLAFIFISIAGIWKTFSKAGWAGWKSLVPFYNLYIMIKIAGRPGWWFWLYLIPLVNLVISIIVSIDLGKAFGRGTAFSIFFLWLMPIIGYLVIGFGDSKYRLAREGEVVQE